MNLPNLFAAQKDTQEPFFVICLLLSASKVQALLLNIEHAKTSIQAQSKVLEYTDDANCLVKTDEVLQDLGPESESINQVIFGLEPDWVKGGDIADEHKPLIKKITTDLSLEALGFVVTSEALVHHLLQQNSLFSGIVLLLGGQTVTANFLAQGTIKATESVGRSADGVADLGEALARFKTKVEEGAYLPGKLLLSSFELPESELHAFQQQLLDHDWEKVKVFLQTPVVDVLATQAYTEVLAQEAARAAALSQGLPIQVPPKPDTAEPKPMTVEQQNEETVTDASEDFGFTPVPETNVDAQEVREEPEKMTPEIDDADNNLAVPDSVQKATSFGVPISPDKLYPEPDPFLVGMAAHGGDDEKKSDDQETVAATPNRTFLAKLKHSWHKPYRGKRSHKFFILAGLVAGVLALLLVGWLGLLVSAQAHVNVALKTVSLAKEVNITLDPEASSSDPHNLVLAVDTVTKDVEGEKTVVTSGVKIVGDPAKGKIKLLNKTEAVKTFAAGTVLKSGNLLFGLDGEVTVASASVKPKNDGTGEEKVYGQAETSVTAQQIGPESNLAKDTELTVADFASNTYSASVIDNLSGGASREVRVVSKDDQAELLADLRQELIEKANGELTDQAPSGTYVLATSEVVTQTAEYSDKVETEADELVLKLKLQVKGLSYTVEDLKPIAQNVLTSEVPPGYELVSEDPQILSAPTQGDTDEAIVLAANITSRAQPVISEDELKELIKGKSVSEATNILSAHEKVERASIEVQPPAAAWVAKSVPKNLSKITIVFAE